MEKNLFRKIVIICLFINLLAIILIIVIKKNLPPILPIFYGLPVSEEQLTTNYGLVIPAVTSVILIIINFYIVKFTKDKFLVKIFAGLIIITTSLSLITIIKTIFLVGVF